MNEAMLFPVNKNKVTLILIFILTLGAFVRLAGINYLLIPDESQQLYQCLKIGRLEFRHNYFIGIYSYLMFLYYSGFFLFGLAVGWFSSLSDFMGTYYTDPHIIYVAGRAAESLAGVVGICGMYLLGKTIFNRRVGLLAAFFLALNLTHVQISQVARGQAFCSLFIILALYFIYQIYAVGRLKYYILAGLSIAAAASIRIFALGLFVPLLLALIFSVIRSLKDHSLRPGVIAFKFLLCVLVFVAASAAFTVDIVTNLGWLMSEVSDATNTFSEAGAEKVVFLGCEASNGWKAYILNVLPYSLGWLLYLVAVLALLASLISLRQFKYSYLSIFIIVFMAVMGRSFLVADRYLLPVIPAFLFLSADLIDNVSKKLFKRGGGETIFICLVSLALVLPGAIGIARLDISRQKKQTQDLAKEWILQNIPDRTRIAVESTGYSGPNIRLYSVIDYDIYRMSEEELHALLAKRMGEDVSGSLALRYFIDHPPQPWHYIYNLGVKEYVDINFLKREKVEYAVISSWVLRDYLSPTSRSKYGDLVESRLAFYDWLEREGEVIKVFAPTEENPGPEIKIYKMPLEDE